MVLKGIKGKKSPDRAIENDQILIENAKKNPQQFSKLYEKYALRIYNFLLYRLGHDADNAEDLTQEVFVRAYKQLHRFHWNGYPYLTYLYRTAQNVLTNFLVSASRKREIPSVLEEIEIPYEMEPLLEYKVGLKDLWRAVQQLPEDQKSAILLYYQKGKKVHEISYIMRKSPNAIKLLLSRGRKTLKNQLDLSLMRGWQDLPKKRAKHPSFS